MLKDSWHCSMLGSGQPCWTFRILASHTKACAGTACSVRTSGTRALGQVPFRATPPSEQDAPFRCPAGAALLFVSPGYCSLASSARPGATMSRSKIAQAAKPSRYLQTWQQQLVAATAVSQQVTTQAAQAYAAQLCARVRGLAAQQQQQLYGTEAAAAHATTEPPRPDEG